MGTTKGDTRSLDYSSDGDFLASLNVTFSAEQPALAPKYPNIGAHVWNLQTPVPVYFAPKGT